MLDPDNIRHRVFYKLLKVAGLRKIRFHDLCHTYASLLLQQGESPVYVKEQMGHSSIQVTVDLYGHLIPGGNRRAVDRLDEPSGTALPQAKNHTPTAPADDVMLPDEPQTFDITWSRRPGLNGRPAVYETAALPTELRRHLAGNAYPTQVLARPQVVFQAGHFNRDTGWRRTAAPCPGGGTQSGSCSLPNRSRADLNTRPLA